MKTTFAGTEADRPAVEAFLAYYIQNVIDSRSIRVGKVEKAIFLGSRILPEPAPAVAEPRMVDNSSNSIVPLATGVSAAAIVAMFLLYFAIARRRRRKSDEGRAIVSDKRVVFGGDGDDKQPPLVAVAATKSLDTKSGSAGGSTGEDEEKSDAARCVPLTESNRLGPETASSADENLPSPSHPLSSAYSLGTARTASSTVADSVDSHQSFEDDDTEKATNVHSDGGVTDSAPPNVVDILPPKPPKGKPSKPPAAPVAVSRTPILPVVALKSLTQRRKKKKKKKPKIVRSNSRENVNEMETITEGEEETSGDNRDGDDGSEYSWCSTDDSDPGSREPSPARSRGSREPSPARSTSSGSDRELAAMGNSGGAWDNGSIGLPAAALDSGEKSKAMRLPPQWI